MPSSANERKDEAGLSSNPAAVREEEEERRWSGSLHRGTWSSVTAGSTPPTPVAAAAEEAEADAAVGERWIRAASVRVWGKRSGLRFGIG
uniref:B1168G10.1 protein n=1 Tax=Oryza sativa subsp. japonica TaxID=39947 RepID=Q5H9W9_ORYSJ|nr:P0650D04.20 [Oryza sativa Japonica Group]CAI44617.1 B1168G10.1 [Oryza sativa Japonica Group]